MFTKLDCVCGKFEDLMTFNFSKTTLKKTGDLGFVMIHWMCGDRNLYHMTLILVH